MYVEQIVEKALENILLKIVKHIDKKPILAIEHQLWDDHAIAEYFGYSLEYTKNNIISCSNFPPARLLPTSPTKDRHVLRWKATDVIKYGMAFDKHTVIYN